MKTQRQFSISIRGRTYYRILEREETTSREDTTSVFGNSFFGKIVFHISKARGYNLRPLKHLGRLLRDKCTYYATDNR
jgi:hypothetical protein